MPATPNLFPLDTLGAPTYPHEPVILDPTAADDFYQWLEENPTQYNALRDGLWRVEVFNRHLDALPETMRSWFRGPRRFLQTSSLSMRAGDEWMVQEILRLVFAGEVQFETRAKLLILARRRMATPKLRFISNCPRLASEPDCVVYFRSHHRLEPFPDWPADFDLFHDMRLNRRLRQVAQTLFEAGTLAPAIHQAAMALEEAVQAASGSSKDGLSLMQEMFKCDNSPTPTNRKPPLLSINNWSATDHGTSNERNEAIGYRHFFEGVPSALRNPTAHDNFDTAFSQSRFGDKVTVAKVLCFLSLLFEKLENRP